MFVGGVVCQIIRSSVYMMRSLLPKIVLRSFARMSGYWFIQSVRMWEASSRPVVSYTCAMLMKSTTDIPSDLSIH